MKLSAQGKLRLAAKLAFAAGASSLVGVAQAADGAAAAPASGSSSSNSDLLLAQAATNPAPSAQSAKTPVVLQGVEVTGSRIRQPSLTSSAALQTINSKEFQITGTVNVETLLNNLPSVFANQNNTVANGATGTATVDLRGLGPARTLVLIDGKRVMPGDPRGGPEVDLNFIPAALVDHVEVLTGGASAVYGSDAISGVVNFIMKKDFEGFHVDGQWSMTDHGDGTSYDATAVWGTNFANGAGNITLYTGYTRFIALTQAQRDYSQCALASNSPRDRARRGYYGSAADPSRFSPVADAHVCQGSGTIPNARFISYDRYYAGLPYDFMDDPNGQAQFVPYDGRTFNYAPYNYTQRPDKRYVLGGFAHREFNEHLDLYGSGMFMYDRTAAQIAPSGTFFRSFRINCNNPLMSASQQQFLCTDAGLGPNDFANVLIAKRTIEFQPRTDDISHIAYRIVLGARGAINDAWSYDVSAQRGETILADNYLHDLSVERTNQALQAITGPNGQPECMDPNARALGCVPLNLFRFGGGAITPDQIAWAQGNGFQQGTTIEQVVTSSVTGDLGQYGIQSPLAKSGVGVAGGFEYRTESLDFRPDFEFQSGDLAGQGGPIPPVKGAFNVRDWFGELQAPLVEDQPFVHLLQFDTAYRLSNYSSAARYVHAYKFGLRYAPTEDVTVRASFNRAVRAPDIQELFFPNSVGLFAGADPCAGATPSASLAQCQRTGVTQGQYGHILQCSAGQCNALFGGNQNLQAEKALTRQLGLVFTPRFLKGFTGTIDYFNIVITGAIGTVGAQTILNQCISSGQFCSNIHRGPTGLIWGPTTNYVANTNINAGFLKERGIDFSGSYDRYLADLGLGDSGRIDINFTGTWLNSFQFQSAPGVPRYDCAGLYGITCGFPNPRWRHKLRVTWESPASLVQGLGVSLQWRYVGSTTLDVNQKGEPAFNPSGNPADQIDAKIPIKQYMDLALTYRLPVQTQDVTLRFGVNNLGNEGPPVVSSGGNYPVSSPPYGNGNTFPGVYDALGRVFFLGVDANFQ